VVEHPLGKGEVVSSILTGSTTKSPINKGFCKREKNALGKIVQNEARNDAAKRTKSAPDVRRTFSLHEARDDDDQCRAVLRLQIGDLATGRTLQMGALRPGASAQIVPSSIELQFRLSDIWSINPGRIGQSLKREQSRCSYVARNPLLARKIGEEQRLRGLSLPEPSIGSIPFFRRSLFGPTKYKSADLDDDRADYRLDLNSPVAELSEAQAIRQLSAQIETLTGALFGKPVQPLMCLSTHLSASGPLKMQRGSSFRTIYAV
jgi:hypothetical protein